MLWKLKRIDAYSRIGNEMCKERGREREIVHVKRKQLSNSCCKAFLCSTYVQFSPVDHKDKESIRRKKKWQYNWNVSMDPNNSNNHLDQTGLKETWPDFGHLKRKLQKRPVSSQPSKRPKHHNHKRKWSAFGKPNQVTPLQETWSPPRQNRWPA